MTRNTYLLRIALPLALVSLAGCSGQADDAAPDPAATTDVAPAAPEDSGPDDAAPAPPPVVAGSIPDRFLGVWDRVEGSCEQVSETRIEIGPKAIGFYESHGEVTRVEVDGPDRVIVSLAMEGEGEKWQNAQMFTLSEGGSRLTSAPVSEDDFEPVPFKKCPITGG